MASNTPKTIPFYKLAIIASDGNANYRVPTGQNYRKVAYSENAHLEYRVRLGDALNDHFGVDFTKNWFLIDLPRDYELWQYTSKEKQEGDKPAKTRVDHYVFGHPSNAPIRSQKELLKHLIWLCGVKLPADRSKCACSACRKLMAAQHSSTPAPGGDYAVATTAHPQTTSARPAMVLLKPGPVPSPSVPALLVSQPSLTSKVLPPSAAQQRLQLMQEDMRGLFVFRHQELVWFTESNTNWGLGIVVSRERRTVSGRPSPAYQIQPLGPPYAVKDSVWIPITTQMRPYLSWTPPRFTSVDLDHLRQDFLQIDWQRQNCENPNSAEVDSAIFMAKNIDRSLTVEFAPNNIDIERLFLGPESIWKNDYVTLKQYDGIIVLLVQAIRFVQNGEQREILLGGMSLTLNCNAAWLPEQTWTPDSNIHPRLIREQQFFQQMHGPGVKWTMIKERENYRITEIKGRWYGTSEISWVLNSDIIGADRQANQITHASKGLNDRGVDGLAKDGRDGLGRVSRTRREVYAPAVEKREVAQSMPYSGYGAAAANTTLTVSQDPPGI